VILIKRNDVHQVNTPDHAGSHVSFREVRHVFARLSVVLLVLVFELLNLNRSGLSRSSLDPQRSLVGSVPLTAFKALESVDHQRGPRLVHRDTHAIVNVPILISVSHETSLLFHALSLGIDGVLHSFLKLIEGVLCLKP